MSELPLQPFDPDAYVRCIQETTTWLQEHLPLGFKPKIVATLGSGGLGEAVQLIEDPVMIPYAEIPYFSPPTVVGHAGEVVAGRIAQVPVLFYRGRRHFYEFGDERSNIAALREIAFPLYVGKALGGALYIGTNAAGGLNPRYQSGDLMVLKNHIDLFYPNVLLGPPVPFAGAARFQPQSLIYDANMRAILRAVSEELTIASHVHEGVYTAVTGPTYESAADCQLLRKLGADAVGMSTVPEVIVATNIGMKTVGLSLITNVVAEDGTNATSHEEVTAALNNPQVQQRFLNLLGRFIERLAD